MVCTIKQVSFLVNIQLLEKTVEALKDVFDAMCELPLYYFVEYPEFRHSVVDKLKEYDEYEDENLQKSMLNLKKILHEAFLDTEFVENTDSTIDDEDYDFIVQYV